MPTAKYFDEFLWRSTYVNSRLRFKKNTIYIISYVYCGIFTIIYSSSPELSAEGSDEGLEFL